MVTAQCCCAAQADSRLVTLQIHLRRFGLHTGLRWPNTSAVPHGFWQNSILTAQCCCAKQADSRLVTANTPKEIWSSYRFAVAQHQCSATLLLANCNGHCSVLLCNTGRQQAGDTANTTMEICSSYRCAVARHQSSATLLLAKCNCPLLSADVQHRQTAGL